MTGDQTAPVPATVPCWPEPGSIFGSFCVTMVIEDSRPLTIPPDPSPAPPDAGRCAVPSRVQRQSCDCGYIVSGLSTGCYLPAVPPRVLMMGHQVPSEQPCSSAQFFTRLLVANLSHR